MYGVYSLGGFALLSIATCAFVVAAFSIAAAAARSLGAGARAIWVMFLPVLVAAPWAWSIRAQMLALPLYTGLLWLLASEARRPTRRVWLAFPLLVVWANVHGSVALGALLVMLLGAYELVRSRGRDLAAQRRARRPRPARRARDAVRPGRRPRATTTSCSSTRRSPDASPSGAGRTRPSNTMFFYVLAAIAIVARLARPPSADALRHRRPRAHVRRRASRDPRDRLVRARVHGLRPGRDRPQAREQEARASRGAG